MAAYLSLFRPFSQTLRIHTNFRSSGMSIKIGWKGKTLRDRGAAGERESRPPMIVYIIHPLAHKIDPLPHQLVHTAA